MTNPLMSIAGLHLTSFDEQFADAVPAHLRDGLHRYIEHGILPGSFMQSVLANDLLKAVCRAGDDLTVQDIKAICVFLRECTPAQCHGTAHAVQAWHVQGGLQKVSA